MTSTTLITTIPRKAKRQPRPGEVPSFEFMSDAILIDKREALRQYEFLLQKKPEVAERDWNYDFAREWASKILQRLARIEQAFGTEGTMALIDMQVRRADRILGPEDPGDAA
jgi:hypothetical protein